jgi:hypothetical protein
MEFDDLPREKLKELIFQETENFHHNQLAAAAAAAQSETMVDTS